ncbi:ATP-binding protein [Streptomyces sp. NPDC127068]|uniref:ATP-binding protein n=1 Tax=Streptomyces sp. NPDC127068 TaxID=3347127 RepID=UPI003668B9B0
MPRRIAFRLPRHPASVALARHRVREHLIAWGRTEGDGPLDDTVLLVSELVTEAVRHGPLLEREFEVAVTVLADGGCFIEVTDENGTVPGAANRVDGPGAGPARGRRLLEALTEVWGVWHGGRRGTTVWALVPARQLPLPTAPEGSDDGDDEGDQGDGTGHGVGGVSEDGGPGPASGTGAGPPVEEPPDVSSR